jgi:hypothetical protein
MRRNLLLVVLVFSLVFFFSKLGLADNSLTLTGTSLSIHPCVGGGTVEIDANVSLTDEIVAIVLPITATGSAGAVLDTVLTGGLNDANPPAFNAPSLFSAFTQRIVNPYGIGGYGSVEPMLFVVVQFAGAGATGSGLYCKMFYNVTGPGTIVIDTMTHSTGGSFGMNNSVGPVAATWGGPYTFNVVRATEVPPVVNCPGAVSGFVNKTISIPVTATDAGGTAIQGIFATGATCGSGSFSGTTGAWSYDWNTFGCDAGTYPITFGVYDECETTYCTTNVTLIATVGFVQIGVVSGEPCEVVTVPVQIQPNNEFGAFDLYIEFDPSVLYFLGVEKGDGLPAGWEYFTYRQLPCPNCGCCKYKIELLGLADKKDLHVGETIQPNEDFITIANLKFKIACNEDLRGNESNICFEFDDEVCGENTFSDPTGNILYVSDNSAFYPGGGDCPVADDETIVAKLTFVLHSQGENPGDKPCGGVMINSLGSHSRGDINLNGIAYDPADLTLFSEALINGVSVFPEATRQTQLALTDINADGYVLSLSDFILMIRVMLHDASAIPKPTPGSDLATIYAVTKGNEVKVSTNANLGAALFVFQGDVKVNTSLKNVQGVVDGQTRVLVYMSSGAGITGELLTAEAKPISVEAVDNFGRSVKTTIVNRAVPTAFSLNANYPNPFNPTTNISFGLPIDSRVSLKIYNVAGQLVRTLVNETMVAGTHTVTWDGTNSNGEKVASGIYFYKLNAGDFSKTMKMVMTK